MSRPASLWLPCVLAALLPAGGCGAVGAHYVREWDGGGVVGIPNNTDVWPTYYRSKAVELMSRQCPDGYQITGEDTVRVRRGAPGGANDNPHWDYTGGLERIPEQTEYQITFRCAPAAPPPAGPAPK